MSDPKRIAVPLAVRTAAFIAATVAGALVAGPAVLAAEPPPSDPASTSPEPSPSLTPDFTWVTMTVGEPSVATLPGTSRTLGIHVEIGGPVAVWIHGVDIKEDVPGLDGGIGPVICPDAFLDRGETADIECQVHVAAGVACDTPSAFFEFQVGFGPSVTPDGLVGDEYVVLPFLSQVFPLDVGEVGPCGSGPGSTLPATDVSGSPPAGSGQPNRAPPTVLALVGAAMAIALWIVLARRVRQ